MNEQPTRSSQFGEWFGGCWRRYIRMAKQIPPWLIAKGLPEILAVGLKWLVHLGVLFLALIFAFGILIVVAIIFLSVRATDPVRQRTLEWAIGEQYDERDDPFYDPINNSHIADPKFDDD